MPKYIVDGSDLTSVANTIRTKGGTSGSLSFPNGWNSAINAISGGGGLEYEEGTFTPTQDVANPTIYFANNHTAPPMNIVFYDATGTADFTTDTEWVFTWNDLSQVGGTPISISSNSEAYARVSVTIRGSSTSSLSGWLYNILTPYSDTSESSDSNYRYWVTTSMFRPFANQTTRYCRAGRTYKWIAVWAPTT